MRILLISYFYPPFQNVAASRWSRFVRELSARGHELEVVCGPWSTSKAEGVTCIADPFSGDAQSFRKGAAKAERRVAGMLPTFLLLDGKWLWSLKVRGWLKRRLKRHAQRPDLVLVTGAPWSSVLATAAACRAMGQRYGVDFRDLWGDEPFAKHQSKTARFYARTLERWVLAKASLVTTINEPMAEMFRAKAPHATVVALPNGYVGRLSTSAAEFNGVAGKNARLLYAGTVSVYHGADAFLKAYKASSSSPALSFLGHDSTGELARYGFTPEPTLDQSALERELRAAGVLVLLLGRQGTAYTTGKLMDYVKAERPVLYFGPPHSPAAELIRKGGIGWVVDCENPNELARVLAEIKAHFDGLKPFAFAPNRKFLEEFSLEVLSEKLNLSLRSLV